MIQPELAIACRHRAAETFLELKPFPDTEEGVTTGLILVDALRRASRFDAATAECDLLSEFKAASGLVARVLRFQRFLVANDDTARHTVGEADELPDVS